MSQAGLHCVPHRPEGISRWRRAHSQVASNRLPKSASRSHQHCYDLYNLSLCGFQQFDSVAGRLSYRLTEELASCL